MLNTVERRDGKCENCGLLDGWTTFQSMAGILVAENCRYFRIGDSQIQDDEVMNTHRI